jgi:DNA-binding NarL/FixJ family response regulator
MSNPKARVIVVDDHPLFRERLCQLINDEQDMEICGEAENAQPALQIIRETSPNLAIVDITLKTSSGLELVKNIRALSIGVPVLILSMHDESLYAERALRAGAMGYITKSEEAAEVILAVRSVLAGKIYLSQEMTSTFLEGLTTRGVRVSPHSIDRLTDRELQVLDLIGRGRTSQEIGEVLKLTISTVDTYRARIKQKMNLRNSMELQHFAIRWLSERE